jgi:hypothetical protein
VQQTFDVRLQPRKEHRWGIRVPLDIPVVLESPDQEPVAGRLLNASVSGAFVATSTPLPPFTSLRLVMSGKPDSRLELPACVARITDSGLGVEWRDMACPQLIELLREVDGETPLTARDRAFR